MAVRYASALFSLAQEQNELEAVATDLGSFSAMLKESEELRRLTRSPVFSADEKMRALSAILERVRFNVTTANFLKLVARKHRLFAIADMIAAFRAQLDAKRGVAHAEITLAEPISAERLEMIKDTLRQTTAARSVDVAVKIDPSIIGGVVVRIGSRMVDGSLRTKLNSLRTRMKEVR